jgi:drug/metabolite transporter (DMT)-like permease
VLVPALAIPIFGDRPTAVAWAGIALVVAGLIWLHRPLFAAALARGNARDLFSAPAFLTGLTIAAYSLNDAAGVDRAHPIVYLYCVYLVTIGLLTPYVLTRKRPGVALAFAGRTSVLVGGIGSFSTYMIVLAATRIAPVSYVVPMRETSIVVGAVLAARLLHEPLGRTRLTACCLVMAGVMAIGIGG